MINFSPNILIQPLPPSHNFHTTADVLRLDLIHPVISGNKWFKLKEYLHDAGLCGKRSILTFGGAFSNHILATAAAAQLSGFSSIGIIRGEKSSQLSQTLVDAQEFGMKLFFISREAYREKQIPEVVFETVERDDVYIINEGGYGATGKKGAEEILNFPTASGYSHIISAVGTGTTLAGLVAAAAPGQQVIGISVLKNNFSLEDEILKLLLEDEKKKFQLLHDFHFGGYAKYDDQLLSFMNGLFTRSAIPTDFVYTGKLFYAVEQLLTKGYFARESKLLIIHSGGLQGNRSLGKGKLIF